MEPLAEFRDDMILFSGIDSCGKASLLGKGQGRVKTGQQAAFESSTPLANLHLTLAPQFSAERVRFNNVSTGPLSGLFV